MYNLVFPDVVADTNYIVQQSVRPSQVICRPTKVPMIFLFVKSGDGERLSGKIHAVYLIHSTVDMWK
jgi:hypothetical protein